MNNKANEWMNRSLIKWCALFVLEQLNALKNKIKIGQPNQRHKSIWISMAWDHVGVCNDISVSRAQTVLTVNVLVGVTLSLKNHLNAFLTNFFPIAKIIAISSHCNSRARLLINQRSAMLWSNYIFISRSEHHMLRHDHEYELWHICLHKFKRSQHVHKFSIIFCVAVVVYVFSISVTLYQHFFSHSSATFIQSSEADSNCMMHFEKMKKGWEPIP